MNVGNRSDAAQFHFWEYLFRIFGYIVYAVQVPEITSVSNASQLSQLKTFGYRLCREGFLFLPCNN
jgi:hypothetical protein